MRLLRRWLSRIKNLFARKQQLTGFLPDPSDSRDYVFVMGEPGLVKEIPTFSEYGYLPSQGSDQECVGFTLARLMQVLLWQETGLYRSPSTHYIWYNAKEQAGWEDENKGVYPRDAFKRLFKDGYVPTSMLPRNPRYDYTPTTYQYRLGRELVSEILLKRNYKYYRVGKNDAIELALEGQPTAVSLPVAKGWYTTGRDGFCDDMKPTQYYHYMTLEGEEWKDGVRYVKFMNWWRKRYLHVPYDYYIKHATNLWTISNKKQ